MTSCFCDWADGDGDEVELWVCVCMVASESLMVASHQVSQLGSLEEEPEAEIWVHVVTERVPFRKAHREQGMQIGEGQGGAEQGRVCPQVKSTWSTGEGHSPEKPQVSYWWNQGTDELLRWGGMGRVGLGVIHSAEDNSSEKGASVRCSQYSQKLGMCVHWPLRELNMVLSSFQI